MGLVCIPKESQKVYPLNDFFIAALREVGPLDKTMTLAMKTTDACDSQIVYSIVTSPGWLDTGKRAGRAA